jgi:hypothetical protein
MNHMEHSLYTSVTRIRLDFVTLPLASRAATRWASGRWHPQGGGARIQMGDADRRRRERYALNPIEQARADRDRVRQGRASDYGTLAAAMAHCDSSCWLYGQELWSPCPHHGGMVYDQQWLADLSRCEYHCSSQRRSLEDQYRRMVHHKYTKARCLDTTRLRIYPDYQTRGERWGNLSGEWQFDGITFVLHPPRGGKARLQVVCPVCKRLFRPPNLLQHAVVHRRGR